MRKILCLFLLFSSTFCFANLQQTDSLLVDKQAVYQHIEYEQKRTFKEDLKEKYNDDDFIYTEDDDDVEEEKDDETSSFFGKEFVGFFLFFISKIFPFLLGGFIIFIVLKTLLGSDVNFWNFKRGKNKVAKKLIYEDEDINETDIDGLLQKAIYNKEYRLAIRYYYLSVLKLLSDKKLIDYHKDKTNSEYLFEIENEVTKKQFSYLSYIYSYVWYGDFPVDETNFKLAENKYKSFKKSLK